MKIPTRGAVVETVTVSEARTVTVEAPLPLIVSVGGANVGVGVLVAVEVGVLVAVGVTFERSQLALTSSRSARSANVRLDGEKAKARVTGSAALCSV
jgi:hypothetical protein